jgi:hypothetical protein
VGNGRLRLGVAAEWAHYEYHGGSCGVFMSSSEVTSRFMYTRIDENDLCQETPK